MSGRTQRFLLAGLLATLAVAGLWQLTSPAPGSTGAVVAAPRRASGPDLPAPPGVQLAVLDAARTRPSDQARNPFVFGVRQAAAPPPSARPPVSEVPSAPAPFVPVVPAGPPPAPPIPLKFIGLVEGAAGTKIAVLSDSKGFVAHGSEGAIIDGRYRILAIGTDTLELAYTDGRGRQTLRLSGQ